MEAFPCVCWMSFFTVGTGRSVGAVRAMEFQATVNTEGYGCSALIGVMTPFLALKASSWPGYEFPHGKVSPANLHEFWDLITFKCQDMDAIWDSCIPPGDYFCNVVFGQFLEKVVFGVFLGIFKEYCSSC